MDLESSSFDFSINIYDTSSDEKANIFFQCSDPGPINLAQVRVA